MNLASGQCEATITTVRGLSDLAKWYEMWEGVVAVAGMCVRAGYAGLGFHRGELVADNDHPGSFCELCVFNKRLCRHEGIFDGYFDEGKGGERGG